VSITEYILAEGRKDLEQGGPIPQSGAGRTTTVDTSRPASATVAELQARVDEARAGILVRNTHLAEILDEGNNALNAWALRLHMERNCGRDECHQGATILETENVLEKVLQS